MLQKIFLLGTTLLLLVVGLQAQDATLTGRVTDAATGEGLISATVAMANQGQLTDYDGNFEFRLPTGEYQLEVRYLGYETFTQSVVLKSGEATELRIELLESATLLQTATVSSSRYEKPLSEVTVSLEVLQPNLINNTAKVSLDDALQKVPGVTVIDGQANIRSGSGYSQGAGSRVLLLMDDVPILQADAGSPNWQDIPLEIIEQVEVIKGAASALYGSSALNGIINVRTAYAKSDPITQASVFGTSFMSPQRKEIQWWDDNSRPYSLGASLSHRRKMGKVDLVLGGYYLKEESFRRDEYDEFGRFNFNVRHRISDRLSYSLAGNFNNGKNGNYFYWAGLDSAYVGTASTISERERFRYNLDPSVLYYDDAGNRHRFLGRFYSVNNENSNQQGTQSDLYYAEYQFQRRFDNDWVLSAGLVGNGTQIEAELYGDTTFQSRNWAGYLQLERKFWDKLNFSFGARYEANRLENPGFTYVLNFRERVVAPSTTQEARPVFRLGLNYQAAKATFLRASWGQGYRYPTVAERYIFTNAGGFFITPSPELGSETGWSAELALKQGYRLGGFEGFVDMAIFHMDYQNMIEFNWAGTGFQSQNIGDTRISGAEITVAGRGQLGPLPFQLFTGYTYANPRFVDFDPEADAGTQAAINAANSTSDKNVLKYRFRHTFKFDGEVSYGKFRLGWETLYNSSIEAYDPPFQFFIPGIEEFQTQNADGFWVHTARVAFQANEGLRASLLLGNLTNVEYTVRPALLEAPRNLTLRLDYQF